MDMWTSTHGGALLAAADQTYSEALTLLDGFAPWSGPAHTDQGRHALTPPLLKAFDGWNKALLDEALAHNGTSCALSSFPQDHRPDAELLRAITRDLAAAWREFALELNARLVAALAATTAALGVFTVTSGVAIVPAVVHQLLAVALLGAAILAQHRAVNVERSALDPRAGRYGETPDQAVG